MEQHPRPLSVADSPSKRRCSSRRGHWHEGGCATKAKARQCLAIGAPLFQSCTTGFVSHLTAGEAQRTRAAGRVISRSRSWTPCMCFGWTKRSLNYQPMSFGAGQRWHRRWACAPLNGGAASQQSKGQRVSSWVVCSRLQGRAHTLYMGGRAAPYRRLQGADSTVQKVAGCRQHRAYQMAQVKKAAAASHDDQQADGGSGECRARAPGMGGNRFRGRGGWQRVGREGRPSAQGTGGRKVVGLR